MARPKIIRGFNRQEKFLIAKRKRNTENQRHKRKREQKLKRQPVSTATRVQKCKLRKKMRALGIEDDFKEHYLGPMNIECSACGAKHFAGEIVSGKTTFNDCCSHGEVPPISFQNFPSNLKPLFTGQHKLSTEFLNNIRGYNSSVSFASFNANLMNFRGQRPGPYCFKIRGRIYYQINTALYPKPDENSSFGQLFILDPSEANTQRLENMSGLNPFLLKKIDKIIRKKNSFAKSYIMMNDEIKRLERKARRANKPMPEVRMSFLPRRGMDVHRYNPQRSNEVAAIFTTTADGDIPDTFVTVHNQSMGQLEYVSTMDPKVEPWLYPLFYPRGEEGWHRDMERLNSSKRISRSADIKNKIAIRGKFNPFLYGGKLFQQWIVDNYVKIEKDRIEYCRAHQKELRSESYQGVIDFMKTKANDSNSKIGKMIILPSTFIGSPRNMAQNYQDAMAIVRKYGKPDLFITMTCNPNWREITENLEPGQQACNRPDLVARVFNLKKDALLELIKRQEIFGKVKAFVYVVEFQKRGLPHMHLLITLQRNYKITSPEVVDKLISAEIPDPDKEPRLFKIVMRDMIHGPCADFCLKNGKCSKRFPKKYQSQTVMDEDGYPSYRRRNNGLVYERPGGYVVDNRFVVPYSPLLLRLFNCHINVEVVSSIHAVKYLFKYIYKGHDAATIKIEGTAANVDEIIHDEINEHIETRYVGPVEACWRILSKKLQEKSHCIYRMPVHLPNQQNLIINPGAEDVTVDTITEQKNMLLDYFALNVRSREARQYFYTDIPSYYVFNKTRKKWEKRKTSSQTIGRMYSVNPSQVELFHLRLLLLTVKGAKNFEDLRKVNEQLQPSFTAACIARGLIADDHEWQRAMHEASVWMMPYQLRRLFVRILVHCQPLYPKELWEEFKDEMSEDFIQKSNKKPVYIKTLQQIDKFLQEEGKELKDFPTLPSVTQIMDIPIDDAYFENLLQIGHQYYNQLNIDQKTIVDTIMSSMKSENLNNEKYFYIDGPGGSGKTFVYMTLWYLLTGKKKKIQTMAYTGIAAILLPKGKTMHKTFGLPVPLYPDSISTIKMGTRDAKNLHDTDMFIWDEAPMAPRYALEVMDRTLRDIMSNDIPFGGKFVITGGDFRQLLPVNIYGTRSETINLSIKFSSLWNNFKIFHLTKNMRTLPEEKEFSKFLLDVGNGTLNDNEDNLELPETCVYNEDIDIAQDIYGKLIERKKFKELSQYAILAARNVDVDDINKCVVELLDITTERIYTSVDAADNCNQNDRINLDLLPEYLNSLSPASLPPYELKLRKFSVIMLIRNLNIYEGLCNGTRLLVLELGTNLLRCEILTGDKAGEIVFLNRITLICDNVYPFTFTRRQFPVKLAFAITINKAQGQTFEKIGIDLRKDVFNHGQLYVAMSRVRSWKSLRIYMGSQRPNSSVKNFVYKELYSS